MDIEYRNKAIGEVLFKHRTSSVLPEDSIFEINKIIEECCKKALYDGCNAAEERANKWDALVKDWYAAQGSDNDEGEFVENEDCDLAYLGEIAQSHIEGYEY